jgi:NAD(P)-dependent dehydrogenase (short-subunit alcohol dehydrogenase family)
MEAQMINSIPLSRFGNPDEVADLIAYVSSENASFITGSNFLIDGGQSV